MQLIEEKIIAQIHKEGPLRFHDFMEMVLYDPDTGYYTSPGEKTGSKGDYCQICSCMNHHIVMAETIP